MWSWVTATRRTKRVHILMAVELRSCCANSGLLALFQVAQQPNSSNIARAWKEKNIIVVFFAAFLPPSGVFIGRTGWFLPSVLSDCNLLIVITNDEGRALGQLGIYTQSCPLLTRSPLTNSKLLNRHNLTISWSNRLILISLCSLDPVWLRQKCSSRALAQTTSGRWGREMTDRVYFIPDHILTAGPCSTTPGHAALFIIFNLAVPTAWPSDKHRTPAASEPKTRGR